MGAQYRTRGGGERLKLYFDSIESFIAMGGHGPYVWAAYGITVGVMLALVWTPVARRRRFIREQLGRIRREERQQ